MRIWTNTLIKDEDRFVWFSILSVINYVDRVLVWDTGSTDMTEKIVQEISKLFPQKIEFMKVGDVTSQKIPLMRQKMLEKTFSDWVILVDGDEVWWDDGIKEVVGLINQEGSRLESIVNRYHSLVGDIFHYQSNEAGRYSIDSYQGHLNIRAMSMKIPGLHVANPHPLEAYFDANNTPVQERPRKKRFHLEKPSYLHLTHLKRSTLLSVNVPKRKFKFKYELGNSFSPDFYYPEVFFKPYPSIVPNPWEKMQSGFLVRAIVETPLKKLRRTFFRPMKS